MSTMFDASTRGKTCNYILELRRILIEILILKRKSMSGIMGIFIGHEAIDTQREILASITHNIGNDIFYHQHGTERYEYV